MGILGLGPLESSALFDFGKWRREQAGAFGGGGAWAQLRLGRPESWATGGEDVHFGAWGPFLRFGHDLPARKKGRCHKRPEFRPVSRLGTEALMGGCKRLLGAWRCGG